MVDAAAIGKGRQLASPDSSRGTAIQLTNGESKRAKVSTTAWGTCAYCGAVGPVTDGHVPPRSLFPTQFGVPKIPSRSACNGGLSGDDEYFRAAVALRMEVENNPAVNQMMPAIPMA